MQSESEDFSYLVHSDSQREEFQEVFNEYFNCPIESNDLHEEDSEEMLESDEEASEIDEEVETELELLETDIHENQKIGIFLSQGCGCSLISNESCSKTLTKADIVESRNNMLELTSGEQDLVILSTIKFSSLNTESQSCSGRKCTDRNRTRITHNFMGNPICLKTFLFLNRISKTRYYSLVNHFKKNGLTLRTHGNKRRLPSSTCSPETTKEAVRFITNMAEEHALVLPGRIPGYHRSDVKLLPSTMTKHSVWEMYVAACVAGNKVSVGYSKFVDLWNQLVPYIVIMRPATDLCWTCQKNNSRIFRSANLPESQKSQIVLEQQAHIGHACNERENYKKTCSLSKQSIQEILDTIDVNEPKPPCSFQGMVHYSYDYAQQLHYPSNPQQPGPIFFKTPRKCGLFGVCCEALPRQVNFLIDESACTGKGADATISYIHSFFQLYGLGETEAYLHADNCGAQNKNNAFIWYYMWRIITGLHDKINYSFLIAGHTKFSPDWCFGLLKRKIRKTFISSLFDIAYAVESSSVVNSSQLVGLHDGQQLINTYQWTNYLGNYFKKLPKIKCYQHFRFDSEQPGIVFCREFQESDEVAYNLLKNRSSLPPKDILPAKLVPAGLKPERKEYLFKEIREFCSPGTEDLVAPKPAT